MKMKKSNKTEQEIQREMEEFSKRVREFREAQRKAFHGDINKPSAISGEPKEFKDEYYSAE